jgi:cyclitol oxidoreductase
VSERVLITGGSRGIGLAMVEGLLADGHSVTNLSRTPPPLVTTSDGADFTHLECDLRAPNRVRAVVVRWLASKNAKIDAFIHNAVAYGTNGRRPAVDTTLEEWNEAMDVNARSLLLILQLVLPGMLERRRGRILGVSSDIAIEPGPGRIPYAASKAAAHAIMIGLADELRDSGVGVAELMPTHQVDTPGIRSRRPANFEPIGYAKPATFVSPIQYLLTCNMSQLHGSRLSVDADGRLLDASGELLS